MTCPVCRSTVKCIIGEAGIAQEQLEEYNARYENQSEEKVSSKIFVFKRVD